MLWSPERVSTTDQGLSSPFSFYNNLTMQFLESDYETLIDHILAKYQKDGKLTFGSVFEFRDELIKETQARYQGCRCAVLPLYKAQLEAYDTTIYVYFPEDISYGFQRVIEVE